LTLTTGVCQDLPPSVRTLFWNLNSNVASQVVASAARSMDIDLLVLAENANSLADLAIALNDGQDRLFLTSTKGLPALRRSLTVFFRYSVDSVRPVTDGPGVAIFELSPPSSLSINVVAVHLRSKLHSDGDNQLLAAVEVRELIEDAEELTGHRRTVVVGDLNMDPFEPGVVAANALHGVMSRAVAATGSRTVNDKERRYFYNPMWNQFGDHAPGPPGTYYRSPSGFKAHFWHVLDQILIRPELLERVIDEDIRVVTSIDGISLLDAGGRPNSGAYSDHLPIFAEIDLKLDFQNGVVLDGENKPMGADQREG